MLWQRNFEDQGLVVQVEAASIAVCELTTIQKAILCNEVVVAQAEYVPLLRIIIIVVVVVIIITSTITITFASILTANLTTFAITIIVIIIIIPKDRHHSNTLPLLIKQRLVLVSTIVESETTELRIDVEV